VFAEMRDWAEELACRAGFDGLPTGGRLVVVVVALVALGAAAWSWWSPAAAPTATGGGGAAPASMGANASTAATAPAGATTSGVPTAAATVTVHVVGEVRRPGVYQLAAGSRAIDAVEAAGGLLGGADQAAVNLARVVADGEQIAVPKQGASVAAGAAAPGAPAGGPAAKVDLNTANEAQLDALPGIGPATAAKIVADRTANGPYRTVDDLLRVPGIGPAKLQALKPLVTAG
jgi:competence protein ComEA